MNGKNLTQTVTNILHKVVTDEQAKQFALDNFGELCAYIRAEQTRKLTNSFK